MIVKTHEAYEHSQRIAGEILKVVVAGQEVPDRNNIEWDDCCKFHKLYGVWEAKHWLPVVKAMKRRILVESELDWMAGICHALDGKPDAIMKIIQGLPSHDER